MGAQGVARLVGQGRHPLVNVERGAHRAQRVVVVGDRCTEQRHDIVAHMLVDRAAIALDDAVDRLEIAVEQRVGRLGAERARKFGVTRDVGEQHGHLAPLAGRRGRFLFRHRRFLGRQFSDRGEQLLAVAERADADLLQVVAGQRRQRLAVDLVLGERLGVLIEAEVAQPARNIHRLPSLAARFNGRES